MLDGGGEEPSSKEGPAQTCSDTIDNDAININFIDLGKDVTKNDASVIYCPVSKEKHNVEYAINLLKHSNYGLWVGLNRYENAAISAIEVLNLDHRYDLMLEKYREKQSNSVKGHDKEERITKIH